jgi:hypothetical protein
MGSCFVGDEFRLQVTLYMSGLRFPYDKILWEFHLMKSWVVFFAMKFCWNFI